MSEYRLEKDMLGERQVPKEALWGIHTLRAIENFPLTGRAIHPELIKAYGWVKLACAGTNRALGVWRGDEKKADAIEQACREMAEGKLTQHVEVDLLQGGGGTSTNMNVNEVIANRALQILGQEMGDDARISPLDDINRHQSTNDTYPTAMKIATIVLLDKLVEKVAALHRTLRALEERFADVVKVGRTQLQDAVLTTLGSEMSAYAGAIERDLARIEQCRRHLYEVSLGATAIGTGIGAPQAYIARVVDELKRVTGLPLSQAGNLFDATQNDDVFVEISGVLKAHASSLLKLATDFRIMASGPDAGFGELILPQRQAGSSIMPGKINPVIVEAVTQGAMLAMGHDTTIAYACGAAGLELNPILPLVTACLFESIDVLTGADDILRRHCLEDLQANRARIRQQVETSAATMTTLLLALGYQRASAVLKKAKASGQSLRQVAIENGYLTEGQFEKLISPEAVRRRGMPDEAGAAPATPKTRS